ncbi:DUF11 domain-containing protein [Deinococcus murrayi]|uniref:DUF11 domain-containing protein n=1 Tax=Deinococcus murrayi TaxID=68910 RepID=UPI00047F4F2C|nr:DUF11 domain-containing protein [Deinococcus murrayi]
MKRWIRALLPALGLLGLGTANAQSVPLAQRVTETGTINYVTTGASFRANSANSSTTGASCLLTSSTAASVTGYSVANGAVSPARTAAQTVPSGATVTKAYLYWTASAGETGYNGGAPLIDNSVKFYVDGTTAPATNNVTASRTWSGSLTGNNITIFGMGAFADVTSIVRPNPNAQFRMDDLTVFNASGSRTCNTSTMYGNWGLYIIYSLPSESNKTLALFDGLQYVGGTSVYPTSATSASVTLSGLRVPNAAPGTEKIAKTTLLVSEGDASTGASNDSLTLNTNLDAAFGVSNSLNPANDVFNGSITVGPTDGGTATGYTASTSPGVVGGLDLDTFDLSSRVSSGTTSLTATVDSATGELLVLYSAVLMATTTTADLSVTKSAPATQQGAGTLTYTITASNAGPHEAYNVVVSDPLPAGVTFVSASGGGSYDAATRRVTWTTGKFLPNTSQNYTVTVTVPNAAATYQNTVSVSSGSFDPNSANNSASASTVVTPTPDLSLTKSGPQYARPSTLANTDPAAGPVGPATDSFISYTLTVSTAIANATGTTTVTDTLPVGLSWAGGAANYTAGPGTWSCGVSGQVVTCTTTSPIVVGTPQTITLRNVRVAPGTAAGATFTNTATVSNPNEAAADNNAGNTGTATTRLVLTQVSKQVRTLPGGTFGTNASVRPGDLLEYCIDTRNLGGADLANYVLTDNLSSNGRSLTAVTTDPAYGGKAIKWTRTPASGAATNGNYTAASGDDAGTLTDSQLTVNLGTLLAGETVRTCFQVQVR